MSQKEKDEIEDKQKQKLGSRIAEIRLHGKNRLSQEMLAEVAGCSTSHISDIERGTSIPTVAEICRICNYYDVDLSYALQDFLTKENPYSRHKIVLYCKDNVAEEIVAALQNIAIQMEDEME